MVLKLWVGSCSKFRTDTTEILSRIVLEVCVLGSFLSGRKHVLDENRSVEVIFVTNPTEILGWIVLKISDGSD